MHSQMSYSGTKLDKTMNPEQFNQVVEAILAGKYSWACVLICVSLAITPYTTSRTAPTTD
jgi:hypothetical protein